MMGLLGFLIVLPIVILIHELGHFLMARLFGVKVLAFSIGFGRAIYSWVDSRGTVWKLGWLPFGGYVSLYGQEDMFDREKYKKLSLKEKRGHYLSVAAWKQAIIIGAGVVFNVLLAWVLFVCIYSAKPIVHQPGVIGFVEEQSIAEKAGIKPGDRLDYIGDEYISSFEDILTYKMQNAGRDVIVKISNNGIERETVLNADEKWGIGPDISKAQVEKKSVGKVLWLATSEVGNQAKTLFVVLKQIVTGDRSSKQLGSFLTIAQVSGDALSAGVFALMTLVAVLCINLAVINILPLPVLDGGFLLILLIEAITRRKLNGKVMNYIMLGGWVLIAAVFIMTMKNDIFRVLGIA